MQHEEFDDITIQRYLDGDMNEQERQDFEQLISENEAVKNEVQAHQMLAEGVAFQRRKANWEKIQTWEKQAEERQAVNKPTQRMWPYYAVAASVAVLIAAYLIFNTTTNYEQLAIDYFEPYPASVLGYGIKRNEPSEETPLNQALLAYQNSNYQQAITLFEEALTEENDPGLSLLAGISYLGNDEPERAIELLTDALEAFRSSNPELVPTAEWYLGLSYLQKQDVDQAKEFINRVKNSDDPDYSKKANQLYQSIN